MLRKEDLSDYTLEAIDFQKADLKATWVKVNTTYDKLCLISSDNMKETHMKFVHLQKQNVWCINLRRILKRRFRSKILHQ